VRVAVDVMGGDHAPAEILQGCWQAVSLLDGQDTICLVGDPKSICDGLAQSPLTEEQKRRFQTVATTQVIAMDDPPVEAIRNKPDSSIAVMCKLAAKRQVDAVISAGNTGACVAAAQLRMRLLPGVSRPGIAIVLPTFYGPVVICDVGANIAPKPQHLEHYAFMAGAYATASCGVENPRVGLLNVGEEDAKGTAMVKETGKLLRDEPQINFVGNVEGRDLFKGLVDVVVCDGFVGNIVLKFTEGIVGGLFETIVAELQRVVPQLAGQFSAAMEQIYNRYDWQEYGGAPLLGVNGYCLICHGRSQAKAIKNAIRVAKQLTAGKLNDTIVQRIKQATPSNGVS